MTWFHIAYQKSHHISQIAKSLPYHLNRYYYHCHHHQNPFHQLLSNSTRTDYCGLFVNINNTMHIVTKLDNAQSDFKADKKQRATVKASRLKVKDKKGGESIKKCIICIYAVMHVIYWRMVNYSKMCSGSSQVIIITQQQQQRTDDG